ncbi:hypothetical protein RJT34_13875 [Clitoria ternatea]|uniref:CCHC-type domain-containing protein n=1 Tax=Clitoria ternatea TaxID=43366 RepID=A0AAN9JSB6_CLITE
MDIRDESETSSPNGVVSASGSCSNVPTMQRCVSRCSCCRDFGHTRRNCPYVRQISNMRFNAGSSRVRPEDALQDVDENDSSE